MAKARRNGSLVMVAVLATALLSACGGGGSDRRSNDRLLLIAEQAAVAGVRIQRGHAQLRLAAQQPGEHLVQQANLFQHRVNRQVAKHVA